MVSVIRTRNPSREIDGIRVSAAATIAHLQSPQIRDHDRRAVNVVERRYIGARGGVEYIDGAVAEIPHQQIACVIAEAGGSDRHSPGGIQVSARDQPGHERSRRAVDVHVSVARAGRLEVLGRVLQRIGDVQIARQILDIEGRITRGKVGVLEGIRQSHGRIGGVEDVDISAVKIRSVKVGIGTVCTYRQTRIDRPGGGVVHHHLRCGRVYGFVPAGYGAVQCSEDERRRFSSGDSKTRSAVVYGSGRSACGCHATRLGRRYGHNHRKHAAAAGIERGQPRACVRDPERTAA